MFKANLIFHDKSVLNDVFLYKEPTLWTSIITDKIEADKLLYGCNTIYFGNDGIQGWFIPKHVRSYDLIDLSEEEMSEIRNIKLIKE